MQGNYMRYYNYIILKKENNYLAVIANNNSDWELGHYYDQGYAYFMDIRAFNANSAIEQAKQSVNSELIKLKNEINHLYNENKRLRDENHNLKRGNQFNSSTSLHNIKPLEVLGFKEQPTKEELKNRYRSISQKIHPDKEDGSEFIMKLINEAYEQLKKEVT